MDEQSLKSVLASAGKIVDLCIILGDSEDTEKVMSEVTAHISGQLRLASIGARGDAVFFDEVEVSGGLQVEICCNCLLKVCQCYKVRSLTVYGYGEQEPVELSEFDLLQAA